MRARTQDLFWLSSERRFQSRRLRRSLWLSATGSIGGAGGHNDRGPGGTSGSTSGASGASGSSALIVTRDNGWVFPSNTGKPHHNASAMGKAFEACLKEIGVDRRFSSHGLRRTANDFIRRAASAEVARAITGQ